MVQPVDSKDPWSQVEDLYGDARYKALGIRPNATQQEVRQAYRKLAKQRHPDKGGSASGFAQLQDAFVVLSDPQKRSVYDSWAKELQFRYVQGVAAKVHGGEGILLDQLDALGMHCNADTQLVVLCEVCARPATKDCWTCGMKICDFCTLKRHWKDTFPLHWPLINSDHMRTQLAKRELERKRIEDAHILEARDPGFRSLQQRREMQAFQEAACQAAANPARLVTYAHALGRFYMWAQTSASVFIVCHVPTGHKDQQLLVDCTVHALTLQALGETQPLIERSLDGSIDASTPLETYRTADNQQMALTLPKQEYGLHWSRLFRGDTDGVRCMQPPCTITETDGEVTLEFELPFWIEEGDVQVDISGTQLSVFVRNELSFCRTYWRNREAEERNADYTVVDITESLWSMDSDCNAAGVRVQLLTVNLVRPALTADEIMWKKGRRMDNRAQERPGGLHHKGVRFFQEDEDEFGLEDTLQALCFQECGSTFVPAKPWQHGMAGKQVAQKNLLSASVQTQLQLLGAHRSTPEEK